jgi:hypothetical protein
MVSTAPSPCGRRWGALLLFVVVGLSGTARAVAGDTEVREFTTYIDGKKAGGYRMTITTDDKSTVTMVGSARVSLSILRIKTYTYSYDGTEVWKDGRLFSFTSNTNDNGTKYAVTAVAEREALRVTVNDRESVTRGDVWVTTYWRLPDVKVRGQPMALLDGDTGLALNGTLQYIGDAPLTFANQQVNCAHYQLIGNLKIDFWYDGSDRLVRQEWVEDGHRVVLHLDKLSR